MQRLVEPWSLAAGSLRPGLSNKWFYLGATPDDVGVTVEIDPEQEEKYYEVEVGGGLLFL